MHTPRPRAYSVSPEGTEEETTEGQRRTVSAEDTEDDTEGHSAKR